MRSTDHACPIATKSNGYDHHGQSCIHTPPGLTANASTASCSTGVYAWTARCRVAYSENPCSSGGISPLLSANAFSIMPSIAMHPTIQTYAPTSTTSLDKPANSRSVRRHQNTASGIRLDIASIPHQQPLQVADYWIKTGKIIDFVLSVPQAG